MQYNPRINADAPHQFFAGLGFEAFLSLVANLTLIRAPALRNVVIAAIPLPYFRASFFKSFMGFLSIR